MSLLTPGLLIAIGCAVLALVLLWLSARSFGGRHRLSGMILALMAVTLGALGAGVATLEVAARGYRALTHEEVAARVRVIPESNQRFRATFELPDGRQAAYRLAGDELYVDAQILKWTPFANLLGLHTAYDLDRVAGRYRSLGDEREQPRTVFTLAQDRRVDLFALRHRIGLLSFLVDAEYGSATFFVADRPASYELRVSTSGLLVRPLLKR